MKRALQVMTIGLIIASVVISFSTFASFVERKITVGTGVKVYVNDNPVNLTDANGNPVEAFIYKGTTYLPVRAIANAFNTDIKWDGKTGTVYVGKHKSNEPAVLIKDLDYFTGSELPTLTTAKDNLGNTRINVVTQDTYNIENIYKINGKYSSITGTLFQLYEQRSSDYGGTLRIYGDGKLLYEASMKGGIEPIDFNVDITGVLELKIFIRGHDVFGYLSIGISNFGLYH